MVDETLGRSDSLATECCGTVFATSTPTENCDDSSATCSVSSAAAAPSWIQFRTLAILSPCKNRYSWIGKQRKLGFKMIKNESRLVRAVLQSYGFVQVLPESRDFSLLWTTVHLKAHVLCGLASHQRCNHFPRSQEITRKDNLYRNVQRAQFVHGREEFNFIPEFYVTPDEIERFKTKISTDDEMCGPWIVKPVGSSRGRGIFLINLSDELPLRTELLVSRYIPDPYLINGHKFDVRLYVAVTFWNPMFIYLYREGLIRFASGKYSLGDLDNVYIHLTNYSINKHSETYVKNADPDSDCDGHKWTFSALLRHLRLHGHDTRLLMLRIEALIVKTLLCVQSPIAASSGTYLPYMSNSFELFGFDILLDSNLKPWLLEVNLSPSLSCDAVLDFKVKSRLVCDALTLVGVGESITEQELPLREQSDEQKLETAVRKLRREEKRMGGFIRLFPAEDSHCLYNSFSENLEINLDARLHRAIFPSCHSNPIQGAEKQLRTLRAALSDCQQVASMRQFAKYAELSTDIEYSQLPVMLFVTSGLLQPSELRFALYHRRPKSFAARKSTRALRGLQSRKSVLPEELESTSFRERRLQAIRAALLATGSSSQPQCDPEQLVVAGAGPRKSKSPEAKLVLGEGNACASGEVAKQVVLESAVTVLIGSDG